MTSLSFYEVSAQVIPVLILALVVQERTERAAGDIAPSRELFLLGCVVLAAVGEIISLSSLIEEKVPVEPGKMAVLAGVVVPFFPFLMRLAGPSVEIIGASYPSLRPVGRFLAWALPLGLVVLTVTDLDATPIFGGLALVLYVAVTGAATFLKPAPKRGTEHLPRSGRATPGRPCGIVFPRGYPRSMIREEIETAVDEWVREIAVNPTTRAPESAGAFRITDYRPHLIGSTPTGDPPTGGLRAHHFDLRFLLTTEETKATIEPMLDRLQTAVAEDPELGGRLGYRSRLELGGAAIAKRGERNPRGGPVVVVQACVREFDFSNDD